MIEQTWPAEGWYAVFGPPLDGRRPTHDRIPFTRRLIAWARLEDGSVVGLTTCLCENQHVIPCPLMPEFQGYWDAWEQPPEVLNAVLDRVILNSLPPKRRRKGKQVPIEDIPESFRSAFEQGDSRA